jgi:hypothetical protein
MPKKAIIPIQIPMEQPDCCARCPLIGLIPKNQRQPGVRQSYVCLGVLGEALPSKGIWTSASEAKQKKRKHHRPCDTRWDAWAQLPGRKFGMSYAHYLQYRLPYEQGNQLIIKFKK